MRRHVHEEVFAAQPERLFGLLVTPSAVRAWWGAATVVILPEEGGYWTAAWGASADDPDYVTCARLVDFDPPHRLTMTEQRYFAKEGPLPFEADFVTTFEVERHVDGAVLRVIQEGFPDGPEADAFYQACVRGWKDTFEGIRHHLDARP